MARPRRVGLWRGAARLAFLAALAALAGRAEPASGEPVDAILHVGPHKTGSTTIEAAALVQPVLRRALAELDNISLAREMPGRFIGAKAHANLGDALMSADVRAHPTWRWLVRYARAAFAARRRLLVSTESLSSVTNQTSLRILVATLANRIGFRVRVVVIHRRLPHKLPSVHSELFMNPAAPVRAVAAYLPFVDWLARNDAQVSSRYMQTAALRRRFARAGVAEVAVLDIHRLPPGSSLTAEFACAHLRAAHACALLRSADGPTVRDKNARPRGLSPLYDLIYGAARARGQATIAPFHALGRLVQLDAGSRPDLAVRLRCLNASLLEGIWRATLAEEEALARADERKRLGSAERAALRADFEGKARGALCSADADAALADPRWRVLLRKALRPVDGPGGTRARKEPRRYSDGGPAGGRAKRWRRAAAARLLRVADGAARPGAATTVGARYQ